METVTSGKSAEFVDTVISTNSVSLFFDKDSNMRSLKERYTELVVSLEVFSAPEPAYDGLLSQGE